MVVREISRDEMPQVDYIGFAGENGWGNVICAAGLIGLSNFNLRWFVNERDNRTAALAQYEDYRIFPQFPADSLESRVLAEEIFAFLAATNALPDEITIVGRQHHLIIPPGFGKNGPPTKHFKMLLRMKDLCGDNLDVDSHIRLLTNGDLLNIQLLLSADKNDTTPFKRGSKRINAGLPYFGWFENDRLVAMSGCYGIEKSLHIANLGDVYVHPRYRKKGIGSLVIMASLKHFRNAGVTTVGCDTGETDAPYRDNGLPVINHLLERLCFKQNDEIYYQNAKRVLT